MEINYLLDRGFVLSQEDLGLEEFRILDMTIVVDLFLLGFEVKRGLLVEVFHWGCVNNLYEVY